MPLSTGARDRGRELAQRLRVSELARQEFLAELHPACPRDGVPGTYIGIIGTAGAAMPIHLAFTCPKGDIFAYSPQTGEVWPISHEDERSVCMEPLDRLKRGDGHQPIVGAPTWSLNGPPPR
jgi:hypothetical protein